VQDVASITWGLPCVRCDGGFEAIDQSLLHARTEGSPHYQRVILSPQMRYKRCPIVHFAVALVICKVWFWLMRFHIHVWCDALQSATARQFHMLLILR
jgi:hypothetical protein